MAKIDAYSFGRISIDGTIFTKDMIIFPDGSVKCPWWRISGHRLEIADVEVLIEKKPETIIAGTGASGLMSPSEELLAYMKQNNIEFIALPTGEAVRVYNETAQKRSIGGCFHLTC